MHKGESGEKGKNTQEQVAMQQGEVAQGSSELVRMQQIRRLCKTCGEEFSGESELCAHVEKGGCGSVAADDGAKQDESESPPKPGNGSSSKPKKRKRLPFSGTGIKKMRRRKSAANRYTPKKKVDSTGTVTASQAVYAPNEAAGKEQEPMQERPSTSRGPTAEATDNSTDATKSGKIDPDKESNWMEKMKMTRAQKKQILAVDMSVNTPPGVADVDETTSFAELNPSKVEENDENSEKEEKSDGEIAEKEGDNEKKENDMEGKVDESVSNGLQVVTERPEAVASTSGTYYANYTCTSSSEGQKLWNLDHFIKMSREPKIPSKKKES